MMDPLKAFVVCIVALFAMAVWLAPPAHSEATQTAYALSNWAKGCDPDDLHYGQTSDGHGQRAFIVTCGAASGVER